MTNHFGITNLDPNMLSDVVPTTTHGGGLVAADPSTTLFLWRSCSSKAAAGGTLAFYLSDDRLEALWRSPAFYGLSFVRDGILSLIEPDFSLWSDDPIEPQLFNTKRKRSVARQWQEYGLRIIPDLNWATEESFKFCFSGIPIGCPVTFTECRTAGGCDADRRAFLKGLTRAVQVVQPRHIVVYGGQEHAFWLLDRLPAGPTYTLLEAWTSARGKIRKTEKRQLREKNQLNLFGGETWVEEAVHQAA